MMGIREDANLSEDMWLIAKVAQRELVSFGRAVGPMGKSRVFRLGSAVSVETPSVSMTLFNRAVGLGMDAPARREEVEEILGLYSPSTPVLVEMLECARPNDLPQWLENYGLDSLGSCAVSCLRLLPQRLTPTPSATRIEVRSVEPGDALLFGQVTALGSGWPAGAAPLIAATVFAENHRCYMAWEDGTAVAAATTIVVDGIAKLGRAATLCEHRRRGAHTALIQKRVLDSVREGCYKIFTENHDADPKSTNPSFRNLQSVGFELVGWRQNFGRNATSCTV
jgi:hypothetical protein